MSNKYFNKDTAPSKQTGGEGGSNQAMGSAPVLSMSVKPVGYPGLPGKAQSKSRAGGAPAEGYFGPFYVDKEGL